MRRPLIYSLILHAAVIAFAFVGGLFWRADLPPMETAVVVEVVPVSDKTNVPVRKKQEAVAKSESEKRPTATPDETPALKRAPPKPKVAPPAAEPPRRTASVAAPKAEPAPKAPSAEPAPRPKVQEPAAEPAPASPDPQPSLDAAKPKRKPEPEKNPEPKKNPEPEETPPSSFASVLKTVESLKQQSSPKEDTEKSKDPSEQAASDAESPSKSRDYQASEPVSMSEIDRVRRQIERCWNLPAGARGAENMVVSIRVEMNIDGTPGAAAVMEQERMGGDPYFRAAAESALRAVLNPRCHPFGLPREKYESWKTMTLVFDPKEMFGT